MRLQSYKFLFYVNRKLNDFLILKLIFNIFLVFLSTTSHHTYLFSHFNELRCELLHELSPNSSELM